MINHNMKSFSALLLGLSISACATPPPQDEKPVQMSEIDTQAQQNIAEVPSPSRLQAQVIEVEAFPSEHVKPRNLSIWLPDGYLPFGGDNYPVIYVHDGQNLFTPETAYGGVAWEIDETARQMMQDGTVRPAIIVGIWNTDRRWQEYAPQKAIESLSGDLTSDWLGGKVPELHGDAYLRFITEELKPYIDRTYETAPGREDTFIMGSSMGGLISLYAAAEYPDVFGRAAAVSIHWPLAEPDGAIAAQAVDAMQAYLGQSRLDKTSQKLWFDHGTETLDAAYPPFASAMEAWFRDQGWRETQAQFHTYEGTSHSETAWADRVDDILVFLLSEDTEKVSSLRTAHP